VPLPSDVPSRQPINFGGSLGPKYGRSLDDFAMALGRLASGCPACNGSPKGRRPALNTGELNLARVSRAVGLRDPPLVLTHRWIVVLWRCRLKQKNRVFPRYIVSSRRRVAGSASFYKTSLRKLGTVLGLETKLNQSIEIRLIFPPATGPDSRPGTESAQAQV
jgi:hypothetical protein